MPDFEGKRRTLDEFRGKVVFVFFGYTQCPDVCPTTLAQLAQVRRVLGANGDKIQGVFVTVDPERDTPEVLKAYAQALDPGLVALRGTPEQLTAMTRAFKVFYGKVPGNTEGSYTMDHTAGAYVFDPKGKIRLFMQYGISLEAMTADLKHLLQGD
jgi:protein SCO1/2